MASDSNIDDKTSASSILNSLQRASDATFNTPKMSELIARSIRNQIVRGEIPAGSNLPAESELMEAFKTSRPTLREALRILESEDLLTVRRGARGGPLVHMPSPDVAANHFGLVLQSRGTTLADVYRVRQLIEPPAVRMIMEEHGAPDTNALKAIIEREWAFLKDLKQENVAGMSQLITEFHDTLIQCTGNQTLVLIMSQLNTVYARHVAAARLTAGPEFDLQKSTHLAIRAHEKLIKLIDNGKADKATAFWRDHLEKVREVLFANGQASTVIDIID